MRLVDKVALVTGAGSGNGRGIALRFAEEGADIVVVDVNEKAAEETAAMVQRLGRRGLVITTDISKRTQVEEMVGRAVEGFGHLDILVNNAGVSSRASVLDLKEEEWDRVLNINLKGMFLCTQAVAREMVGRGAGGKIVNIGSINSEVVIPHQVHYASSKGGVRMFTKAAAMDLAPFGINVNAIGPGVIETGMTDPALKVESERRAQVLQNIPWGRIGIPRDVANVALFLASDESDYVTGTIIFVDGGWTIR